MTNERKDKSTAPLGIIEEVRSIRRAIVSEHGNDVDRLCDHLQQVEREFRGQVGAFAAANSERMSKVIESWGDEVNDLSEPMIDEIRAVRAEMSKQRRPA